MTVLGYRHSIPGNQTSKLLEVHEFDLHHQVVNRVMKMLRKRYAQSIADGDIELMREIRSSMKDVGSECNHSVFNDSGGGAGHYVRTCAICGVCLGTV